MINERLDELKSKRIKWVEINKENDFEIKDFLTKIYPDTAHFIFELLQNAEDKGAKQAIFRLEKNNLSFSHNGSDVFTYEHVDAITGIKNNTKPDDKPRIGQFGVGFKSVFAYTNTPEIHSGDYHFQIHDLVVPEALPVENPKKWKTTTFFSFPFNNPEKPAEKAVKEITDGLKNLHDVVMLFLTNISEINYTLPDGEEGSLKRVEHADKKIEIHITKPGKKPDITHWLRFLKEVEVQDDDGKPKECTLATAYQIEPSTEKEEKKWKIIPIDGKVSIFFPAVKEQSNLRFHIHAPFVPTIARDSRKDCEVNDNLRDKLAIFIAEQLFNIHDYGLLTVDFLAVLPNSSDQLGDFYEHIFTRVRTTFQNNPLTPTKSGEFAPSTKLCRGTGTEDLSDLLGDDGLQIFTNQPKLRWVAKPRQKNDRVEKFLTDLGIQPWGGRELFSNLTRQDQHQHQEYIEKWLAEKDDEWLMNFYKLLYNEYKSLNRNLRHNPITIGFVRTKSTDGVDLLVPPEKAQFLPDEEIRLPKEIHFVKKTVYDDDKTLDAFNFLRSIGVEPFNIEKAKEDAANEAQESAVAQAIHDLGLERYIHWETISEEEHFNDLEKFIKFWKNDNQLGRTLFSNLFFLFDQENNSLLRPLDLYLDKPYRHTGLKKLENIHQKEQLWEGYKNIISPPMLADWISFLIDIGIKHEIKTLEIRKISCDDGYAAHRVRDKLRKEFKNARAQWGGYTKKATEHCEDYIMLEISDYLENPSIEGSWQIWQTLISADEKVAFARYSPNKQHKPKNTKSWVVEELENHAWIPNQAGDFLTPLVMTKEELYEHFNYDDSNGLLTAIGFGQKEREHSEYWDNMAKELGFESENEAREAASKLKTKHPFPERPLSNKQRRKEKSISNAKSSPQKEYQIRPRSERIPLGTDKYTYLYQSYTTEGVLICQICKDDMPFKKRDTEYYFESVEILGRKYLEKENNAQYIALCPVCSAMYREFIKNDATAMENLHTTLLEAEYEDMEVPITLGEWETTIRFVETHWVDLRGMLGIDEINL